MTMDSQVHQFQQALLARGIRLPKDDPLFILLVLNEAHFQQMAAEHIQTINKQLIVDVVSSILARQPKEAFRCQGGLDADKAARRLESAASFFANLETRTSEIAQVAARDVARITAGKTLTDLARKIESELARLEALGAQSDKLNDASTKMLQGAKLIYSESRKARINLFGLSLAGTLIFALGVYWGYNLGH